ncbi:MAG: thioredoxin domain-containing protein [Candidatus Omnitrophota bacterium]
MNCSTCNAIVPETNYKCPHCGAVLRPGMEPSDFQKAVKNSGRWNLNTSIVFIVFIAIALAMIGYAVFFKEKKTVARGGGQGQVLVDVNQSAQLINKDKPGQELDIEKFLPGGQMVIVDFYSEYCPPCRAIGPYLKQLDSKRTDILVLKVDINRPGIQGIDWGSPLARQYKLRSIPHFLIYGSSGKLEYEGEAAYQKVMELLQSESISPQ